MCPEPFLENPYKTRCCQPTDTSDYCNPEKSTGCSPTFSSFSEESKWKWYTYCPGITAKRCGGRRVFSPTVEK